MRLADPRTLARLGVLGMNERNVRYIGRYNPRRYFPRVDDKLKTKLLATEAGVTVPALLNVITTQHEIARVDRTLHEHQQFVIKPAQGSGGKGIMVIVGRRGDAFVKSNGETVDLDQIRRHLSNILSGLHSLGGRTDVAIVESLIRLLPAFRDISYEGVPDVRLIVFQGYPVMGMLRLATKASDGKANLHQGAVGVGLHLRTGKAISAVQFDRPVTHHPDTGMALDAVQVPHWRRLLALAAGCYEVSNLGYLGADLVLDYAHGPVLLELNARPGLTIQIANNAGLLPRLRHIESLQRRHADVEARVEYAMNQFAPDEAQQTLWEEPR